MPAYVRLLAYFSNFILLATFLGGGLGCLVASRRHDLMRWFPGLMLVVVLAAWEWLPPLVGVPAFMLPPPSQVGSEFVRMIGAICAQLRGGYG